MTEFTKRPGTVKPPDPGPRLPTTYRDVEPLDVRGFVRRLWRRRAK